MSYHEYFQMFKKTQKRKCPYRAFTFDIVNSKTQVQYATENDKYHDFIQYVYELLEKEEKLTNKKILLKDHFNINDKSGVDGNRNNPITLGDNVTYFTFEGSISTDKMIELFVEGLNIFNINYPFHFNTGVYETNDYGEGGSKMFKGYMPQILEDLSKKQGFKIDRNTICNEENPMEM